jgi:hypothetical protein
LQIWVRAWHLQLQGSLRIEETLQRERGVPHPSLTCPLCTIPGMPSAESLRGLGPMTQKHLRGLMLSFFEDPSNCVGDPAGLMHMVAETVGSAVQQVSAALAVNVHGRHTFLQPKRFPGRMLHRSHVLYQITSAGTAHARAPNGELLPPSPLDGQHLIEWRETADYAATTLSMVAGIVDLETGFKSPLLGGSKIGCFSCIVCPTLISIW